MNEQRMFRVDEHGEVHDATFYDVHTGRPTTPGGQRITQEMVDAILDKINRSGYQSLAEEEKRILHEASKNMN
jgi:hypothetical protein